MGSKAQRERERHPAILAGLTQTCLPCAPAAAMLVPASEAPSLSELPEVITVTLKVPSVTPPYERSLFAISGFSLEEILKWAHEFGGFT